MDKEDLVAIGLVDSQPQTQPETQPESQPRTEPQTQPETQSQTSQTQPRTEPQTEPETSQTRTNPVEQAVWNLITRDVPVELKPILPQDLEKLTQFLDSDQYKSLVKKLSPQPMANQSAPAVEPPPVSEKKPQKKTFQNANLKAFDECFGGML